MRCYADNVLIVLEPLPVMSEGGLHLPQQQRQGARGSRWAEVVMSGPGHHRQRRGDAGGTLDSVFVPNETKPKDRVLVDANAGQDYTLDISIPRHNKGHDFQEMLGWRGEFRIVREDEILAVCNG